jgi:hypothetical protein
MWCGGSHLTKEIHHPHQHAATASWQKERKPILPIIRATDMQRRRCRKKVTENTQDYNAKGVLLKPRHGGTPR